MLTYPQVVLVDVLDLIGAVYQLINNLMKYVIAVALFFTIAAPVYAASTTTLTTTIETIANKYEINPEKVIELANCESTMSPTAWNKSDPKGGAKGLFQYLQPTWDFYTSKFGIDNPDIWNSDQQIEVTSRLLAMGKSSLWTCARKDIQFDEELYTIFSGSIISTGGLYSYLTGQTRSQS